MILSAAPSAFLIHVCSTTLNILYTCIKYMNQAVESQGYNKSVCIYCPMGTCRETPREMGRWEAANQFTMVRWDFDYAFQGEAV